MKNQKRSVNSKITRSIVGVLLIGLFIIVVITNWSQLKPGVDLIKSVDLVWLLVGLGLFCAAVFFSSLSYYFLALKKIQLGEMYLVEWASAGVNRLLPAGIGGMGAHGLYLTKRRHSKTEAITVVATNNFLSTVSHLILLAVALLFVSSDIKMAIRLPAKYMLIAGAVLVAFVSLFMILPKLRNWFYGFTGAMVKDFRKYKQRPQKVVGSLLAVVSLTFVNSLILLVSAVAVGLPLDFVTAFLVFSVGVAFSALLPTPGGLGSYEAGLVSALVLTGASLAQAVSAALLFRIITFFVPLIFGNIVFLFIRRRVF